MKKKHARRLKPLFYRILGGIAIPLTILLFAFTFLLLRREVEMQHRQYTQEGKMALERFNHEFSVLIEDPSILSSKEALLKQIDWITKRLEAEQIDVIDPILRSSILNTGASKNPSKQWAVTKEHLAKVQESLALKRQNIPYDMSLQEKGQKIYGYLPFRDIQKNRMYVAVVQFKLSDFKKALQATANIMGIVFGFILVTAFFISYGLTLRIIRPLQAINKACREMLSGKLGNQVKVTTGDELELLASNFNKMSQALLIMTHRAEDSNPLTQLPGNRQIAAEVKKRLEDGRKFVFFHLDIDHFKAYNDAYGLARGDDALRNTSRVLQEVAQSFENQEIFIGHQGGDDFVMITSPAFAEQIAAAVCKKFDASLKDFYTTEDLQRGYFMSEDARSVSLSVETEIKRQPLMSISIAGVSNRKKEYKLIDEILERAVGVKKQAKKIPYSVHIIDE